MVGNIALCTRARTTTGRYTLMAYNGLYTIIRHTVRAVRDNYNLESHKYVCVTIYQPDT